MSRTTERARSVFYRAGGIPRVLSMIALLAVIGILISRTRDPSSWVWLTGELNGGGALALPVAKIEQAEPEEITPGLTDTDPGEREAAAEQYQALTDRTIELAREEMPAYWRLFGWTG